MASLDNLWQVLGVSYFLISFPSCGKKNILDLGPYKRNETCKHYNPAKLIRSLTRLQKAEKKGKACIIRHRCVFSHVCVFVQHWAWISTELKELSCFGRKYTTPNIVLFKRKCLPWNKNGFSLGNKSHSESVVKRSQE